METSVVKKDFLPIVDGGKVCDLTTVDFEVYDYATSVSHWGKGKGGMSDEPWPTGEAVYRIKEIVFSDFDTFDEDFVKELRSLKPGDSIKLDSSVTVDDDTILINGVFPVLSTKIDHSKQDFFITTFIEVGVDKWE